MFIKMLTGLERRVKELSENLKKYYIYKRTRVEEYKMKNTLEGIKSRSEDTEEWTSNLKDRVLEST